MHPRVPDLLAASLLRPEVWGGAAGAAAWREAYVETTRSLRDVYATLPRQVVHADFNSVNVLYDGVTVTAVLDFEFACVGARILDVATALMEVLVRDEPDWELAGAFLGGYGPLEASEREALPTAMRLRQAALGVWSVGQTEAGSLSPHQACARLVTLSQVNTWLHASSAELTRLLHSFSR